MHSVHKGAIRAITCVGPNVAPSPYGEVYRPMNTSRLFFGLTLLTGGFLPPMHGAEAPSTAPATAPVPPAERGKVDINTADIPTLEAIPEIGTNFANAVVAARPFKSVYELERILKIGPEKMAVLRDKVTASAVKPAAPKGPDNPSFRGGKPPLVNEGKAIDGKEVTERYDRTNDPRSAPKKPEEKK
jgi:hypothetical protein